MVRHYHGYEAGVWFVQETVEGTTPTNPTYLNLAQKTEVVVSSQAAPVIVAKSGSVDNSGISKGVENPIATLTINPSQGSGKDFIKDFTSTDNSFTLLVMIDEATDIPFARITGCKVKRVTNSAQLYPQAGALQTTLEIWGHTILYTSGLGAGSLEAAPNSFVNWSNITVKRNTTTITDWWDVEWTVENDLFRNPTNTGTTDSITRGRRAVTGTWTRSSNATSGVGQTEQDENKNATDVDLQVSIVADTYDFVNSVYGEATVTHSDSEMVGIRTPFTAESLVIA